jgi:peptide deformylase
VQHEVDNLFGTLFLDRVEDKASLTTWAQFVRYREAEDRDRIEQIVAEYGS